MPKRERKEQAAKLRHKREEDERAWAEFDAALAALPPERGERLEAQAADFDPDEWGCPAYRNVGLTIDADTGEVWMHPEHGQAANRDRQTSARQEARRMAREWGRKNMWGKREWTSHIAKCEGVSERTIQRYYKLTTK
ncbi:hypothetical protein TMEC54S_02786 [Thauera mechernichensis]